MNDLSKDYFDCPHCGIKSVAYEKVTSASELEYEQMKENQQSQITYNLMHYIVKCRRAECERLTYIKIKEEFMVPGRGWNNLDEKVIEIQYPSNISQLPDYIPENIKRFYKEAVDGYNFGLLSSASIMCRKVIYEICDKQKTTGGDYKDKITNLGFDKRITDPLLNIKNIGDETVHAKSWDKVTVEKAIDVLGIIIDMIYTQENRIKDFSKHYSIKNQERKIEETDTYLK